MMTMTIFTCLSNYGTGPRPTGVIFFRKKNISWVCSPNPPLCERVWLYVVSPSICMRWHISWDRVWTVGHASSTAVSGHYKPPQFLTRVYKSGGGFGPSCQLDRPLTSLTNTRVAGSGGRPGATSR